VPEQDKIPLPASPLLGNILAPQERLTPKVLESDTFTSSIPDPGPAAYVAQKSKSMDSMEMAKLAKDFLRKAPEYAYEEAPYTKVHSYGASHYHKNFERYYNKAEFKNLGFSPFRDNESIYNDNTSGWSDFKRATGQWGRLAGTGFKSAIRSWGDILTGEFDSADLESAKEFEKAMSVGQSSRGGLSGFVANTFLSSGYTFGIMGEMILESAVFGVLTGGASVAARLPAQLAMLARTGQKFGSVATMAEQVKNTTQAMKNLENLQTAKNFWETTKGVGKTLLPTETISYLANAGKAEAVAGLAKNSNLFGSFYRDIREVNFALSEAKLEGGMTQRQVQDDLTNEFYNKEGRLPNEEEAGKIFQAAQQAGNTTLLTNIPAIYWTNRITFGDNLFRGFRPLAKLEKEYITAAGSKIGFNEKLAKAGKDPFSFIETNFKNAAKSLYNPRIYAKTGIKYFKANLSEGLQESMQEVISGASSDYYKSIYQDPSKANTDNMIGSVLTNTAKQFTAQGFETFMGGFLMGGLMQVAGGIPAWATTSYNKIFKPSEYQAYRDSKKTYTDKKVQDLNELYKSPLKFFAPELVNLSAQTSLSDKMGEAERQGDQKIYQDLKDESTYSHIVTAIQTGSYDIFLDRLKSIKQMDPKTISEAYGTDGNQTLADVDKIITRAEAIKKNYDLVKDNFPSPYNPGKFALNTPDRTNEELSERAWQRTLTDAVFMPYSFNRSVERMDGLLKDFTTDKAISKATSNDFSVLLDPTNLANEIGLLKAEVKTYKEATTPQGKKTGTDKKEKLSFLEDYAEKVRTYQESLAIRELASRTDLTEEDTEEIAKIQEEALTNLHKSYKEYVGHLASSTDSHSFNEAVDNSFIKIKDYYSLKQDGKNLAQAVNLLHSPEGFTEHLRRTHAFMRQEYDNRGELIKQGQDRMNKDRETNALLNRLYERGLVMTPEDLDAYLKDGSIPDVFYDIANKVPVYQGSPEYSEAARILVEHEVATAPTEAVPTEVEEKPELILAEPQDVTTKTPWEELPEEVRLQLEPVFARHLEKQKELGPIEDFIIPGMRQNWMLINPKVREIINAYRLKYKMQALEGSKRILPPVIKLMQLSSQQVGEMSIDQLDKLLDKIQDRQNRAKDKKEPEQQVEIREVDIRNLQEYIDYRRSLAPKPTSKDKLIDTIERIKIAQTQVQGRSEDEKFYIVNGTPYKRVTTVIDPLEKEITGKADFMYPGVQSGLDVYNQTIGTGQSLQTFIDQFKALNLKQFNPRKYDLLQKALEKDSSSENLVKLLNELSYDDSRIAGNTVDAAVREFFQTGSIKTKSEGMTEGAFVDLLTNLKLLEKEFDKRGLAIMAENIVIYDPNLQIAGEVDMLAADREGNVYVFDIKTSRKDKWEAYEDLKNFKSNKIKHQLQLSAYGNILFNNYGIDVKGLGVVPFEIKYDTDGNIQELKIPSFDVTKPEKGSIVYASPGLGKTTLAEKFPRQYVDADKVLYNFLLENKIPTESAQKSGINFANYLSTQSAEIQESLKNQVRDLLLQAKEKGKIVLTSNFWAYDMADQIYLTKDPERIAKEFEKRGDSPEEALAAAKRIVAKETARFELEGKEFVIVPEGSFVEDIIDKTPTIIPLEYIPEIEKVIPKKRVKGAAEEEIIEPPISEPDVFEKKAPLSGMNAEQVRKMIQDTKTEQELERVREILLQLHAGDQLSTIPTSLVSELLESKRNELDQNLDNLKEGDIILTKDPTKPDFKDRLHKIEQVSENTITIRKLNAPKTEITTINREDIPKFVESKWTPYMEENLQKPEVTPQEKVLASETKTDNLDFTSDTGAIKDLADKTEKKDKKEINDEFIKGLGCK